MYVYSIKNMYAGSWQRACIACKLIAATGKLAFALYVFAKIQGKIATQWHGKRKRIV